MAKRTRPSPSARRALFAAALFVLLPASARGDDPPCAKWCREGIQHYHAHEYEEALACYAKGREINPHCGSAQVMYGTCLDDLATTTNEEKATHDQAIAEWEKVLKMECDPDSKATACNQLANCYATVKKDQEKALKWYKTGVSLVPKNGGIWLGFGHWYYNRNMLEEALDCCQKALDTGTLDEADTAEARRNIVQFKEQLSDPSRKKPTVFAAVISLPSVGGLATTPDLATLVVSVPTAAQLVYIDAAAAKEAKRLTLEFQPGRLAVQGKTLYATARGAAKLFALDLESGKVEKTIKLPSPLVELCCHRSKGLLYGTTLAGDVLSIDPGSGRVTTCQAKGSFVAIDPARPSTVYTAGPGADPKKQQEGRTILRKYSVVGGDLKLVGANEDAAVQGRGLDVSADGKRIAVFGEGGWNDKTALKASVIAVFETEKVSTTAGELDTEGSPRCLAFHPFLDMGAAVTDKGIVQFNSRSFVHLKDWPSPGSESKEPRLVAFVDGGKKLACWEPGGASKNADGTLGFLDLVLSADDTAALQKALEKNH